MARGKLLGGSENYLIENVEALKGKGSDLLEATGRCLLQGALDSDFASCGDEE